MPDPDANGDWVMTSPAVNPTSGLSGDALLTVSPRSIRSGDGVSGESFNAVPGSLKQLKSMRKQQHSNPLASGSGGSNPLVSGSGGTIATSPTREMSSSRVIFRADSPKAADGLSDELFAKLHSAFSRYDEDGSGSIDASELRPLLQELDVDLSNASEDDLAAIMKELDGDGSGTVDFEEFCTFYRQLRRALRQGRDRAVGWKDDASGGEEIQDEDGKLHIDGLLGLVRKGREEEKKEESYITEKQRAARQRIHDMLYDLPSFAPDYVYRRWWDAVVLLSALYAYVFPTMDIVFGLTPDFHVYHWILDISFTCLLAIDILVNLNTAVQVEQRSITLVVERSKIWAMYSRTYFPIDFAGAFPLDLIVWTLTKNRTFYFLCRSLRILKIFKAHTLFKFTDRGMMDASFVRFYFLIKPMMQAAFQACCIAHTLTLGRELVTPDLDASACEDPGFGRNACTSDPASRYLYSLWWCWALLTTQGMANVEDGLVYAYAAFVMLGSVLLQGLFIARVSAFFLKSNIEEQNRDSMRSTYAIMKQYGIPNTLQQEVLSFQYHSLQQNAASAFAHVLEKLPLPMQQEVGLYVKVDLVAKVPMFESLSADCKLDLANCLQQTYCEPECFIVEFGEEGREMYFMMHGFADVIIPDADGENEVGKIVATIKRGDFFGEAALLRPDQNRAASIQALTYCDLFQLLFDDFEILLERYAELKLRMEAEARARGLLDEKPDAVENTTSRRSSRHSSLMSRGLFGADNGSAFGDMGESVRVLGHDSAPLAARRESGTEVHAQVAAQHHTGRRGSLHPTTALQNPFGATNSHAPQQQGTSWFGGGPSGRGPRRGSLAAALLQDGPVVDVKTLQRDRRASLPMATSYSEHRPSRPVSSLVGSGLSALNATESTGAAKTSFHATRSFRAQRDKLRGAATPTAPSTGSFRSTRSGRVKGALPDAAGQEITGDEVRQMSFSDGHAADVVDVVSNVSEETPSAPGTPAAAERPHSAGSAGPKRDSPPQTVIPGASQVQVEPPPVGNSPPAASAVIVPPPLMPSWEQDLATVFQTSRADRKSFIAAPGPKSGSAAEDVPNAAAVSGRPSSAPSSPTKKDETTVVHRFSQVNASVTPKTGSLKPVGSTLTTTSLKQIGSMSTPAKVNGTYVGAVDDRIALAEARMLRRIHIAEERVRKDIWEQANSVVQADQKVTKLLGALERLSRRQGPSGDFGGVLGMSRRAM
eukprot:Hpha_TRINITY_DN16706_c1_g1::TRINITY_DN16706_c1_g1_i1::g.78693::m.78693